MADPKTEFVPGEHYFSVMCKHCGGPIPLLHDPSKGKANINFAGEGKMRATCSTCSETHDYPASEMRSYQLALSPPAR